METNAVNANLHRHHQLDLHLPTPVFATAISTKTLIVLTMTVQNARQIPTSRHLQRKEEQWTFVNAGQITFGTTKHPRAPNVKQSLRRQSDRCRPTIVFAMTIYLKTALTIHAPHAPQIPNSK